MGPYDTPYVMIPNQRGDRIYSKTTMRCSWWHGSLPLHLPTFLGYRLIKDLTA